MIKVLVFASLREQLGCSQLTFTEGEYPSSLFALKAQLAGKDDQWHEVMTSNRTLVAVNQTMTRQDVALNSGDEVAFFPPVTGG